MLAAACSHHYIAAPGWEWEPPRWTVEPAPEVLVWVEFHDPRVLGYAGEGRGFRKVDGTWVVAQCLESRTLRAASGEPAIVCQQWRAVAEPTWATLEALPLHGPRVTCAERPDVCDAVGLTELSRI